MKEKAKKEKTMQMKRKDSENERKKNVLTVRKAREVEFQILSAFIYVLISDTLERSQFTFPRANRATLYSAVRYPVVLFASNLNGRRYL